MLANMTIRSKLFGCLAVLSLALLLLSGLLLTLSGKEKQALGAILNDRLVPLNQLNKVSGAYAVLIVDTAHKARSGALSPAAALANLNSARGDIRTSWDAYVQSEMTAEEAANVAEAKKRMAAADEATARLVDIIRRRDGAALDRFVTAELYPAIDPLTEQIARLMQIQIDVGQSLARDESRTATLFQVIGVIVALLSAAAAAGAGLVIARAVLAPLDRLVTTVQRLAQGAQDVEVPGCDKGDEVGALAKAVVGIRELGVARAAADARIAAEQTHVTTSLAASLRAVSNGDLTAIVTADFPAEYEALKRDFNSAILSLQQLLGAVMASTATIRSASTEIAQASEDLSRRTEGSAASIEQTSVAVSLIDKRIRATSTAANHTVANAGSTSRTVEEGRRIADDAVAAMGRVSESAQGIDSVIEGLDKIAFQTRVLAMNAAVEAGRAGEAGRGFAVVADLVSALAMRAEEEAKRARDQLSATQADIETAVAAVERVDGALQSIASGVAQVNSLLGTIAEDNAAQASTIGEITGAMTGMDQMTQQNAAMVEQTSAAARGLSNEALLLAEQAGRFRISNDNSPTPGGRVDRHQGTLVSA